MGKKLIKSVVKALDILEFLALKETEVGLFELSEAMGQNVNTVKGLLNTMMHKGYVVQENQRGGYRLGGNIIRLAKSMHLEHSLKRIVHPYLQQLHDASEREAAYCSLVSGMRFMCLSYINCEHELGVRPTSYDISKNLHIYAQGKIILAYASETEFTRYLKDHPLASPTLHSITTRNELDKELKRIKKSGLAVTRDEHAIGIATMASGIIDQGGRLVATIAVAWPSNRWNRDYQTKVGRVLIGISHEISEKLRNQANVSN